MKRRKFLIGGGAILGAGAIAYGARNKIVGSVFEGRVNTGPGPSAAKGLDAPGCVLNPEQTEGPYFTNSPLRPDIREDREGLRLDLNFQIVSADGCEPVQGAQVEIWHCDAAGRYSGHPEDLPRRPFDTLAYIGTDGPDVRQPPINEKTYLRGHQMCDGEGRAHFTTILPGWYEPRIPHIHVKVIQGGQKLFATQLYFTDAYIAETNSSHPAYKPYGLSPYHFGNDQVIGDSAGNEGLLLEPIKVGNHIVAQAKLGVRL